MRLNLPRVDEDVLRIYLFEIVVCYYQGAILLLCLLTALTSLLASPLVDCLHQIFLNGA